MDRFGYAKTIDLPTFERNKEAAENESRHIIQVMNTGKLVVFTDTGKMHMIKVMDVPFGQFRDKSVPIDNYSNFDSATERVVGVYALSDILEEKLLFATKTGMVKIVAGAEFDVAKKTIASTKLAEDDEVIGVFRLEKSEFTVLQSKAGYFIKLALSDIPEMKKTAVGNHGIKLGAKDEIEAAYVFNKETSPTIIYKEKEMVLSNLKVAARNSKGTKR
jgi:DNA gyrase subunit A